MLLFTTCLSFPVSVHVFSWPNELGGFSSLEAGKKQPITSRWSTRLWPTAITPPDCRVLACYPKSFSGVALPLFGPVWKHKGGVEKSLSLSSSSSRLSQTTEVGLLGRHLCHHASSVLPLFLQLFQLCLILSCSYLLRTPQTLEGLPLLSRTLRLISSVS